MRKGVFYSALLMLGFSLMSSTCSSDDDGGNFNDNSQQILQVENTAETGTWRITNFVDSDQNETNDFNGFAFTFSSDGTLTATNSTTTYTGNWSVTDSNSDDDSTDDDGGSTDDIDFNIFFAVSDTNNFDDLNDDWDIVSYSDNTINLIDVSGGNGGTDLLTFERN